MVIAILGPTASGKANLGWRWPNDSLARSCAATRMQVIAVWTLARANPRKRSSHAAGTIFSTLSIRASHSMRPPGPRRPHGLDGIHRRGHTPIIVGGHGTVFRALRTGSSTRPRRIRPSGRAIRPRLPPSASPPCTAGYRGSIPRLPRASGPAIWFAPAAHLRCTSRPGSRSVSCAGARPVRRFPGPFSVIILDYPLDKLRPLIHSRVDRMMGAGFLAEVETLRKAGFGRTRALAALGYKQLGQHLDGLLTLPRPWPDQARDLGLCPATADLVSTRGSRSPGHRASRPDVLARDFL